MNNTNQQISEKAAPTIAASAFLTGRLAFLALAVGETILPQSDLSRQTGVTARDAPPVGGERNREQNGRNQGQSEPIPTPQRAEIYPSQEIHQGMSVRYISLCVVVIHRIVIM